MEDDAPKVSRRVEEALFFRLKNHAFKVCDAAAAAYADCCRGRTVSQVWACQAQLKSLSLCLGQHTNSTVMDELKRRWIAAGGEGQNPDWVTLLKDL